MRSHHVPLTAIIDRRSHKSCNYSRIEGLVLSVNNLWFMLVIKLVLMEIYTYVRGRNYSSQACP